MVTRPLVVPALVGSVNAGFVLVWSSSPHVCLLVLRATVDSRLSDASVAVIPCVLVVARALGRAREWVHHRSEEAPAGNTTTIIQGSISTPRFVLESLRPTETSPQP